MPPVHERVAAASAAERAACEARFAAARAAAAAAGAPAPFRGPAADAPLGELLLDVLPIAFHHGHALELHRMRGLCGLTLRERAVPGDAVATPYGGGVLVARRAADGMRVVRLPWSTLYTRERVDERGYRGGPADVMARALEAQAPWLRAARSAPRESLEARGWVVKRTTSLIRAAHAGDEQRARELLAAGAPFRCVDGGGRTALHWASLRDSARNVVVLLEVDTAGATVDAQDSTGETPLILASMHGREGAVRALLARGARQDLQGSGGLAALHCATMCDQAGVVELLCAVSGAPVNMYDDSRLTPLALACINGQEGSVRALLARGARQELQGSEGHTALHLAAFNGHAGIVELLCAAPGAAAAIAMRDYQGSTPLACALRPCVLRMVDGATATTAGQEACAAVLRAHGAL